LRSLRWLFRWRKFKCITVLEHRIKGQDWKAAFRRINGKSVDFVICDKAYIKPLLAIELDGKKVLEMPYEEHVSSVTR